MSFLSFIEGAGSWGAAVLAVSLGGLFWVVSVTALLAAGRRVPGVVATAPLAVIPALLILNRWASDSGIDSVISSLAPERVPMLLLASVSKSLRVAVLQLGAMHLG